MTNNYKAPCEKCGGKCCGYVAIEIDKPKAKKDYDIIRWYLAHDNVSVFIDHDKNWHVEFKTPCNFQSSDKQCLIYSSRPLICRDHGISEGDCEYYDSPYLQYFSSCDELEIYLEHKGVDWKVKYRN